MLRIRLVLLSMLAMLAIGAVASTSASAAGQWWINGSKFTGTENVTARLKSGTKATLKSKLPGGEEVDILAEALTLFNARFYDDNQDLAESGSLLGVTITLPSGCEIPTGAIKLTDIHTELEVEGAKVYDLAKPLTGTEFATVTITDCAGEGKYKVTGEARCEVQSPSTEAVSKTCLFSAATAGGVGLKFGTEPATLTAEAEFRLSGTKSGDSWSAKES